jgi:hypothetical protein
MCRSHIRWTEGGREREREIKRVRKCGRQKIIRFVSYFSLPITHSPLSALSSALQCLPPRAGPLSLFA